MRFTHSQLSNNIEDVIQLVKSNNTSEAITLLDGMDIKINHMKTMLIHSNQYQISEEEETNTSGPEDDNDNNNSNRSTTNTERDLNRKF